MDTGLSTSHAKFNGKTITTFGTLDSADGSSVSNDHGLFVAGVAAAASTSDANTLQGVAPAADFHFSSYNKNNGNTYYPTHWANATDDALSLIHI